MKTAPRARLCCGSWIRTNDLRVMSPSSYRCSIPRDNSTASAPRPLVITPDQRVPKKNVTHRAIRETLDETACADRPLVCPLRSTAISDSFGPMYP